MTPRSIRRAAERKAEKVARKAARLAGPLDDFEQAPPAPAVSEARLAANAGNARYSTGLRTPESKAKSSSNARDEAASLSEPKIQQVTGLTGRTVLLPSDDADAYRSHVRILVEEYQPVGHSESELVQALADHSWRLSRIASLEHALYAYGLEQFSEQFANRGEMQGAFAQMHTFLHYEKQFRNLQIHEMRIRRHREKDTAELCRLQQERASSNDKRQTSRLVQTNESFVPSGIGAPKTLKRAINASDAGFVFASYCENAEVDETNQLETAPVIGSPRLESDSIPRLAA